MSQSLERGQGPPRDDFQNTRKEASIQGTEYIVLATLNQNYNYYNTLSRFDTPPCRFFQNTLQQKMRRLDESSKVLPAEAMSQTSEPSSRA